jgi:hypothetical protein
MHCTTRFNICAVACCFIVLLFCFWFSLQGYAMKAGPACSSIVELLLQHGAYPGCTIAIAANDKSTAGITPMHLLACWSPAQDEDNEDESSSSAAATRSSSGGRTSSSKTDRAAKGLQQQLQAFRLLQRHPSMLPMNLNSKTLVTGETTLTFAAYTGAYEIAEQLLLAGADVNQPRTKDAVRPLDLAVYFEHARLACLLLEHGAEVSMLV